MRQGIHLCSQRNYVLNLLNFPNCENPIFSFLAVLLESNREILRAIGFVVLLTASEETLYERISRNTKRPLLQTENPRATLSKLLAERSEAYAAAADFTLDTSDLSHNAAAESLEAAARTAFAWTRKA